MQLAGIGVRQQLDRWQAAYLTRQNRGQVGCATRLSLPVEIRDGRALAAASRPDPRANCQNLIDDDLEGREQRAGISGKSDIGGVGHFAEDERLARLDGDLANPHSAATALERIQDVVFVAHGYAAGADDHVGAGRCRLKNAAQPRRLIDDTSEIDDLDPWLCEQAAQHEAVGIVDLAGQDVFAGLPKLGPTTGANSAACGFARKARPIRPNKATVNPAAAGACHGRLGWVSTRSAPSSMITNKNNTMMAPA
jgi:hypothetical protein